MLKVGITGGIGSGKSTACKVFESLGVSVYYSDIRSKILLGEDGQVIDAIKKEFGSEIYNEENIPDKCKLADIVFNNSSSLEKLNKIVHPAVLHDFENWIWQHNDEKYIIKESALLFETDANKNLDLIVVVYAPLEERIERIMNRDKVSREKVLERINNQMDDSEKVKKSDYVIIANGKDSIKKQVIKLHEELLTILNTNRLSC